MKGRGMCMAVVALALLLGLVLVASAAQQPETPPSTVPLVPVGTAFTYQGHLTDGEQPADGTYDLLFNLYVEETDTTPLDSVEVGDVPVSQGLFTVQVDFAEGSFQGEMRHLEIGVRPGDSEGPYVLLTPRQRLLPAPYALALPGLRTQQNEFSPNLIGGYPANYVPAGVKGATIGGGGSDGQFNQVTSHYGTVAGGAGNWAGPEDGDPGASSYATISGGSFNRAAGALSTISGGWGNEVHGSLGTIGGGLWNIAWGDLATIAGGGRSNPQDNTTGNRVTDNHGTVGGGGNNRAGDGHEDLTNAPFATVAGGENNAASGGHSAVGGGLNNTASGQWATIAGGEQISATGQTATVGGGTHITVTANFATVGGGSQNEVSGPKGTIGGGQYNAASGELSTIGGGYQNTASAGRSTIPGGHWAVASLYGQMAYASGRFSAGGDAQASLYVLRMETSDDAEQELGLNGGDQQLTVALSRTLTFDILVAARSETGQSAGYTIQGVIENVEGSTSFVGTPITTTLGIDNPDWRVQVVADDDRDALILKVTGEATTRIRWVATVRTAEVSW